MERRRGQRVPLAFHVEVSGIGVNGIPYCDHAAASDVSDRGCQVHLTREVRAGDLLTIRVVRREEPADDQESPFLYQAVWVEPTENGGGWIAGLSALEPGNPWRVNFPQESLIPR
jgi:PilZ domain-containing protein